ncbi:hypothetical protein KQH65_12150 [archaeon]|nr:hypothetical protein [archaeon]
MDKEKTIRRYGTLIAEEEGLNKLRETFAADVPDQHRGEEMFNALAEKYTGEELVQVAAETIATLTANSSYDEFHNWDYDHLSSIIQLSNRFDLTLPRNLINGLPEQLIILVDSSKIKGGA